MPSRSAALGSVRSPADAVLLVRLAVVAACVPALMRLPLPRVRALLSRPPRRRRARDAERVVRLLEAAMRIGSPLVRSSCLPRAVTLWCFLRAGRADLRLCFGAGRVAGTWEAHAWLEHEGEPWLEREDPRGAFTVTLAVPA